MTELIVPEAADMCMIDAVNEGRVVRAAVRVQGVPNAAEVEDRLRRRTPSIPRRFVTSEPAWTQIAHFRPRMDAEDLRRMAEGPEDLEFLKSLRPRSSIVAAMTARGRTLGTLTLVTTWSKRRYTADDVSFAQVLARRIGLALDNAGLFSDLESVERRLDTVMSMLDEAITVHDASGDLVYANHAAARLARIHEPPGGRGGHGARAAGAAGDLGRRTGPGWTAIGSRSDFEPAGCRSGSRFDLRSGPASAERWAVVSSEPIEAPDGSLLYAVTTIEDVTELKRSEFAQQLLARAGELLGASIDYQHTLQAIARVAVPQFADWCSVNILDQSGDLQQAAVAHRDPEMVAVARQLGERHPVRMGDKARADPGRRPRLGGRGADGGGRQGDRRARVRQRLGLALVRRERPGDRREIARRAGIALENARLAGEQAEVARVLQRGLRPAELPAMRGFEVATMYRPAGEVNEVGGDFYEAFEIEGGWMLAIGDVVGRGAAAASVTALARYTIRTAGKLTGDPRAAALMLDESLKRRTDLSLCSAVVLVLPDADDDPVRASLLVAGHPLPLLVRAGEVDPVGQPGPLAGTLDQPRWQVTPLELSRGDQLVLYTDGVTEARGESDRFGDQRLRTSLSAVSDPTETVARIESALDSFLAGPPQDDAAILVLLRSGNALPTRPGGSRVQAATSTGGGHDGFGRGAVG